MAVAQKSLRKELGDFNSTICTKAMVVGIEEALGEKAAAISLIAAGRKRGKDLAEQLGLAGKGDHDSMGELATKLNDALGVKGTRLCIVDSIDHENEQVYRVHTRETICSSGEEEGSPRQCTYTLGAIQGFLEAYLNKRLRGKQTESVLRGGNQDVLEFIVL
jgi:predicted hydrocarbon binding protein